MVAYTKNCPNCQAEQTYKRKDHYRSAVNGEWLCNSCANHNNNFAGKYNDIPITWFNVKRKSGVSRGYQWELTIEFVWETYLKQDKKCSLSGLPIGWAEKGLTATASIDRIDSTEGYLIENVQLVHKDINFMKQQYSQEYFVELCKAVADKVKW